MGLNVKILSITIDQTEKNRFMASHQETTDQRVGSEPLMLKVRFPKWPAACTGEKCALWEMPTNSRLKHWDN